MLSNILLNMELYWGKSCCGREVDACVEIVDIECEILEGDNVVSKACAVVFCREWSADRCSCSW